MTAPKFTTINRPTHDKQNYTAGQSQLRELDSNAIAVNERSRTVPAAGYRDEEAELGKFENNADRINKSK